jgi:hypothetical protein
MDKSKNDNRKIFIVESVSTFRHKYAIFAENEDDALVEFIMEQDECGFHELSQEHLGEKAELIYRVTEDEFINEFDKTNDYIKHIAKDDKLSYINVIDYE